MAVGLVLVSHSAKIAEGLVELARQMAPTIALVAAGGTEDGRIGTSFEKVSTAIGEADSGDGVVILCDLGSAILTAEIALGSLDDQSAVRIADAPLVEGAVAAAVAAEGDAGLDDVLAAAETAAGEHLEKQSPAPEHDPEPPAAATDTATLTNREGLHARPAAEFVKLAGTFDAEVTVNGVDAKSLLRIMALGLTVGDEVTVAANGPQAEDAVRALAGLVRSGFGETEGEG